MTVQPDETVSKVLPGAPTTRRTFTTSDALALYAEIYAQAGHLLRVEAQRRGDPDRIVSRETAIRVVAE